jgi:hypothetical protein
VKRISWSTIQPGQILDFNYQGKLPGAKLRKRRCLILNERHMYKRKRDGRIVRLVHALQLSATPAKQGERIMSIKEQSKLISSMGLIREIGEDTYDVLISNPPRQQWIKVKRAIDVLPMKVYKTFSWYKLSRYAVFVAEDLEFDKQTRKKILDFVPEPVVNEDNI